MCCVVLMNMVGVGCVVVWVYQAQISSSEERAEEASGRLDALPSLPRRSTSNYLDLDP